MVRIQATLKISFLDWNQKLYWTKNSQSYSENRQTWYDINCKTNGGWFSYCWNSVKLRFRLSSTKSQTASQENGLQNAPVVFVNMVLVEKTLNLYVSFYYCYKLEAVAHLHTVKHVFWATEILRHKYKIGKRYLYLNDEFQSRIIHAYLRAVK